MAGVILKEQTFDRHNKAADLAHRYLPPRNDQRRFTPDLDRRVWYKCVPDSSGVQAAPAFGVVEIVDVVLEGDQPVIHYQRPSAASLTKAAVLWGQAIPDGATAGAEGLCTLEPTFAAYNTASTPAFDESWGTEAGSYLLKKDNTGFKILGAINAGAVFVRKPETGTATRFIEFALSEALSAADETADATVTHYWGGSDPGSSLEVTNHETSAAGVYMFAGTTGATGIAVWDERDEAWKILQMQCG